MLVGRFSGGEKSRLVLALLVRHRPNLLLLDEPTNHLDLDATLWLQQWLQQYPGTLLMISHDRDFIDATCERILQIEQQQLQAYKGNYSDFERQRAERRPLLGKHGGDLPLGGAVDPGIRPVGLPAI